MIPSAGQVRIHGFKKRANLSRKEQGKLNLEQPCKELCKSISRQRRSKIPRTQKKGETKRNRRKRRFGQMCKKTCISKGKEKIRRMKKERKECNKILSRRNAQGRKGQRSKMKLKRRRRRIGQERKCSIKSRRQGRFGLGCFTCSLGSALLGIGGNLLGGIGIGGVGIGGIGIGGIGIGIGQGTGLGLRLGTGFRINIFQNILGPVIRCAP